MKLRYTISRRHALRQGVDEDMVDFPKSIPRASHDWLRKWHVSACDRVALAYDHNMLVGFFRYDRRLPIGSWLSIHALGTWVDAQYRRHGVAAALWNLAITDYKATHFYVYASTRAGAAFARRMEREHKHVIFSIESRF